MRLLCLYFPRLGAALARKANPGLAGRPVVLGAGEGDAALVSGASAEAAACGVTAGMLVSAARARCPQAAFLPDNAGACLETLEQAIAVLRLKATVAVAIGGRDHVFVDLRELAGRVADEDGAAVALAAVVHSWTGHDVRAGVAATREDALAAARTARRLPVVLPDGGTETELLPAFREESLCASESWDAPRSAGEVRGRLARMLARLQTILSSREQSFREVRLTIAQRSLSNELVVSSPEPMHHAADAMALLAALVSDADLEDAVGARLVLGRLGPSVVVRPNGREGMRTALVMPVRPVQQRLLRAG